MEFDISDTQQENKAGSVYSSNAHTHKLPTSGLKGKAWQLGVRVGGHLALTNIHSSVPSRGGGVTGSSNRPWLSRPHQQWRN